MREIKFRGKRLDNDEWTIGHLIKVTPYKDKDGWRIGTQDTWDMHHVDPETVGQFTGFKDLDGTEIYEGDVIHFTHGAWKGPAAVELSKDGCWTVINKPEHVNLLVYKVTWSAEVIGNIYENPELMEVNHGES